jgi:hypothetical protein
LALAEVAIEGGVAPIHQIHQVRAVADDQSGAGALWAIDFIAFAGNGLTIDGAVRPARAYGAAGGGFRPDGDVIALHA